MQLFLAILRLLRPKQWLKNGFVFAPLIFARELFHPGPVLEAVRAFAVFCFAASAIYVLNDVADVEQDRHHPEKRRRPVASGEISVPQAFGVMALLLAGTALLGWGMNPRFVMVVAAYLTMNVIYSFKLKEILLLDVFMIAAGFMLRVLGGAYAIGARVSSWLVLCSLFISLFLGFAKRRGELVQAQTSNTLAERKVLFLYRVDFIDQMLTIVAAGTVISYALYTVASGTIASFGTDRLIYTTVFVLYGVFRYLYLIHTTTLVENPTNAITSDPPIIITAFLWILSCIALIYKIDRILLPG
jgi:4-hydroxybenzoate polyprenyltransferase